MAREGKFTPGPWEVLKIGDADCHSAEGHYVVGADGIGVAFAQQSRADASLIAAAPALYEALKMCVARLAPFAEITVNGEHDTDDVAAVAKARAALQSAEPTP